MSISECDVSVSEYDVSMGMAERQATTNNKQQATTNNNRQQQATTGNKQQRTTTNNNKQQQTTNNKTDTSYQLFSGFHGHGVKIFVRRVHQFVVVETQQIGWIHLCNAAGGSGSDRTGTGDGCVDFRHSFDHSNFKLTLVQIDIGQHRLLLLPLV